MTDVPLSEAIASLRAELQQAMDEGAGKPLRFLVSALDVELEVAVTSKVSGKASGGLWRGADSRDWCGACAIPHPPDQAIAHTSDRGRRGCEDR